MAGGAVVSLAAALVLAGLLWHPPERTAPPAGREVTRPPRMPVLLRYTAHGGFETDRLTDTPWRLVDLDPLGLRPAERARRSTHPDHRTQVALSPQARSGERSLWLRNTRHTVRFTVVGQRMEAPRLPFVRLTAWLRTDQVRQEADQTASCNLYLSCLDADSRVLTTWTTPLAYGTSDWFPIALSGQVPRGTRDFSWGVSFTMSGEIWVDDVVLEMGSHPLE